MFHCTLRESKRQFPVILGGFRLVSIVFKSLIPSSDIVLVWHCIWLLVLGLAICSKSWNHKIVGQLAIQISPPDLILHEYQSSHCSLGRGIIHLFTGWWFQTVCIFHNIWDNPSHRRSYFSKMVIAPPTSSPNFPDAIPRKLTHRIIKYRSSCNGKPLFLGYPYPTPKLGLFALEQTWSFAHCRSVEGS